MDLILLVVVCVVIGFLVWLLTTRVPMPAGWAVVIQAVALVVLVLYALEHIVHLPNVLR